MTIGELAGLIAALAFAVLVVFISLNLSKLSKIMKELNDTVRRINTTIDVLTKDVDNLSIEVEGLLNKANTLVDDVNGKLGKTDPLFVAIGDLGVTVSDLNESTKQMASNLVSGGGRKKKPSTLKRFVKSAVKSRDPKPPAFDREVEEVKIHPVDKDISKSEVFDIDNNKPSNTAGEITIKEKG